MSVSSIPVIMRRIAGADPTSPIAVFRSTVIGRLDAVFANTIETQRRIRSGDTDFVAVFDNTMHPDIIRRELARHVVE